MPTVVKRKSDGMYLGKFSKTYHMFPVRHDIKCARKYKSESTARAAVRAMGYSEGNLQFEEVE